MRSRYLFPVLCALAAALPSQTIWNVTSGTDLNTVFAGAAPGDIVLLGPGTYSPFQLTKGLTVIGPATILGPASPQLPSYDTSVTVPAGQQARLVGLEFRPTAPPIPLVLWGQMVTVDGDASFEQCRFGPGAPHCLEIHGGNVVLRDCIVVGTGIFGGLLQTGGSSWVVGCSLFGVNAGDLSFGLPIASTPAATVLGGRMMVASSTLLGGAAALEIANLAFLPPAPALTVSSPGLVTLADSVVRGGAGMTFGPGAIGIVSNTNAVVRFARSTVASGVGTVAIAPYVGNVANDDDLVGLSMNHGLMLGQTTTATATAGASGLLLAVLATFDNSVATSPLAAEPIFGLLNGAITLALAAPAPGATVAASVVVPPVPMLVGAPLWLQAAQWNGVQFRLSPVVGGVVH